MRNIYFLAIAIFAMLQVTSLKAQEEVMKYNGSHSFVPKHMTIDNKSFICIHGDLEYSEDGEEVSVTIYDTDFKEVKRFTVTPEKLTTKKRIEERERVTEVDKEEYSDYYNIVQQYEALTKKTVDRSTLTLNSLVDMWKELYSSDLTSISNPDSYTLISKTDSSMFFYPKDITSYWYYEKYGSKYPDEIIELTVADNITNMIYRKCAYFETEVYTGEWKTREMDADIRYSTCEPLDYQEADIPGDTKIYFTQTLLNDDEKFEYLIPVYDETMTLYSQDDRDRDGEIDYKEYRTDYIPKGYNIYSDGEQIGFLNIRGNIYSIFTFGGKNYISCHYDENKDCFKVIYRVDKATNSIEQVGEPIRAKISARKDVVNIEFKEPATENCELIITSTDGRACKRERIAAGSENVKYDTRHLTSGIYNFTVTQNGKVIENGKIVVR